MTSASLSPTYWRLVEFCNPYQSSADLQFPPLTKEKVLVLHQQIILNTQTYFGPMVVRRLSVNELRELVSKYPPRHQPRRLVQVGSCYGQVCISHLFRLLIKSGHLIRRSDQYNSNKNWTAYHLSLGAWISSGPRNTSDSTHFVFLSIFGLEKIR